MPRIPRLRKGAPEAPQAPEAPSEQPTEVTSGDPLAGPGLPAAATGDEAQGGATAQTPAAPNGDIPAETSSTSGAVAAEIAQPEAEQPTVVAPATTSGDPLGDQATVAAPAVEGATPGEDSATVVVEEAPADAAPGFRQRARIRRRLRYLRRYRELAFRDLGGLTFDLHRFGRERPDLVTQKLENLGVVDNEVRTLETALRDRQDITQLREAGIAACPRCQTLHDTDANFCPGCGTALRGAVVRDAAPVTVTPAEQAQTPAEPQPQAQPDSTPS